MCTLTIVPLQDGFRLVVNRDEQRSRASALAPREHRVDGRTCLWPVDGKEGGTWLAASETGLVMSVQNVNPDPRPALPRGVVSRGHIIPPMMGLTNPADALLALENLALETFAPFRLVAADARAIIEARWNRETLSITRRPMQAVCFTTSGLGDHLVTDRLSLFDEFVQERGVTEAMQDAFHAHEWPDRAHLSVRMSRPDARTVSVAAVRVTRTGSGVRCEMSYTDDAGTSRADVGARAGLALSADGRAAW